MQRRHFIHKLTCTRLPSSSPDGQPSCTNLRRYFLSFYPNLWEKSFRLIDLRSPQIQPLFHLCFTAKTQYQKFVWHFRLERQLLYTTKTQYRKFETNIPRKGIVWPRSQFTFMCLWQIYIFPQSVCLFCCWKYVDWSREYINRSQTHECGNWDWSRAIPFLGIQKWGFSLPCSQYWWLYASRQNFFLNRLMHWSSLESRDRHYNYREKSSGQCRLFSANSTRS